MGTEKQERKYDDLALIMSGAMFIIVSVIFFLSDRLNPGLPLAFGFSGLGLLLSGVSLSRRKKAR